MTSASLVTGFLAIIAVVEANLIQAVALVSLAAILDSCDGPVARRTGGDRAFGTNLDSLADLVSFGVVPAMALYMGPLHAPPVLGLIACLAFLLAGAWRLARFPIVKRTSHFLGLPIPVAGVSVMYALVLWSPGPVAALLIAVIASALMVSTVPFPTLHAARRSTATLRVQYERRFRRR